MTDRQLERLRILACPKSYVSSLCDWDRAAVRAAVEELERLRTELGEWWRVAVALNDADGDDAEREALRRLSSLRTGSSWSHVPESVAELMGEQNTRLTAEVARLRAALEGIHALAADPDNRECCDMLTIEADARAALETKSR